MIFFANAKINLGLHIVHKRENGFHDLESCFYPIPLKDTIELIPSTKFKYSQTGITINDDSEDNLCVKAFRILERQYDIPPVKMHMHKIIPIGAGLGGGSADAVAVLKGLNRLYQLNLNKETLKSLSNQLGSDCPFFIENKSQYITGTGDVMEDIPIKLQGKYLMLIYPNLHISTKEAFANIVPQQPTQKLKDTLSSTNNWKGNISNDFEASIAKQYPIIKEIKEELYKIGASYASMSGSGSSIYGIFNHEVMIPEKWKQYSTWILAL